MKQYFVTRKFLMVSIALIAAIMLQLVTTPIIARADDGTTPPPTEEQTEPTPPVEEQAELTPPVEEEPSVSDLPENVDLVVLGSDGEPEPLATQEAAEALANSDPFWCPEGTDPVGGGCTAYATFTDLLTGLQGVGSLTNGTVYVQYGVYGGSESQIKFDGNTLTNIGNLSLVGGWDLTTSPPESNIVSHDIVSCFTLPDNSVACTSSTSIEERTTTFSVPVSIVNWQHNVSLDHIEIDGAAGSGLTVKTTGEVSVTNVTSDNNTKDGVHIEAGNSVTLKNVQADYNGDDGVDISSDTNDGAISLNNVQTNHNNDDGIRIYSKQKSNITLKGITSEYNGGDGLDLQSPVEEALNCYYYEGGFIPAGTTGFVFPYGDIPGPLLVVYRECKEPIRQQLSISNANFSNNSGNGMFISTTGDFSIGVAQISPAVILSPVVADNNGLNGAYIDIFSSAPPAFPWAYYKARAEQLAGGPATVLALDDARLRETVPLVDTSITLLTNNNAGQNYVYHTDAPGTWCSVTADSIACVSPPGTTPITGGENLDLSSDTGSGGSGNEPLCAKNSIIILQLPNNDNVTVFCPISGQISVKSVGKKGLPGSTPDGTTFVSSLAVNLLKNGAPASTVTDGGHLKVSFAIPDDLAGKNFVIMYWDDVAGEWVELPAFADNGGKAVVTDLGGGKQVLEGTKVLADVGLVEVSVNFPGMFMLVVK